MRGVPMPASHCGFYHAVRRRALTQSTTGPRSQAATARPFQARAVNGVRTLAESRDGGELDLGSSEVSVEDRQPARRRRIVACAVEEADLHAVQPSRVVEDRDREPALPLHVGITGDADSAKLDRSELQCR